MKVIMVSRVRMNPYVHLLAAALEQAEPGLTCRLADSLTPGAFAAWSKDGRVDVIHLHWGELLYRSSSRLRSIRRLALFAMGLAAARRAGARLVYTAHNVERHEDGGLLDALADALIYRLVDAVHVHDADAAQQVVLRRRPRLVAIIPHGNYMGVYADSVTRAEARRRFDLPEQAFVYLSLGQVRPYKGLDLLLSAFRSLDGEGLRLVIAGHPHNAAFGAALEGQARGDGRVRLDLRFIADDEMQFYLRAADVCVLPYRSGTTSGSALLALSFGVPLVAPNAPPFVHLVNAQNGILFGSEPDALAAALAAAQGLDTAAAGRAALAVAQSLDWRPIALRHAAMYHRLCGAPTPSAAQSFDV